MIEDGNDRPWLDMNDAFKVASDIVGGSKPTKKLLIKAFRRAPLEPGLHPQS
jgi:hypothetical protein